MKTNFRESNVKQLATMLAEKFSLLFLFIFLCSCSDNCKGIDCLSQNGFQFTIKSETSGNDLLFGSAPQLSKDDIEVFYMKDGVEQASYVYLDMNSLRVVLADDVEEYYVRALGETDAINVQSQRIGSTECCPATTQIEEISVNGDAVTDEFAVITLLR